MGGAGGLVGCGAWAQCLLDTQGAEVVVLQQGVERQRTLCQAEFVQLWQQTLDGGEAAGDGAALLLQGGERIDASAHTKLALALVGQAAFLAARKLLEMPVEEAMTALSDREREVLAWTAAGRRQTEIAETLGLSERTVENHLRRVRRRLGVATTAQAVRVAIRNGEIAA